MKLEHHMESVCDARVNNSCRINSANNIFFSFFFYFFLIFFANNILLFFFVCVYVFGKSKLINTRMVSLPE